MATTPSLCNDSSILATNLAETLTKLYHKSNLKPYISNEYRKGGIRLCYADINKAQNY